ncbi:MAG: hypothetical protein IT436_15125, partial [Phycisphaerales bacterium]|nr:hypothetical protein [Phycisphaerales bacterium]
LNLYLHAFNTRRAGVNLGLGIGSLVLGTLVFVPIAVVGLIIASSPGPGSNKLSDLLWALGGLAGAAVVTWQVVSRYRRRFQLGVFTAHLRHTRDCAGCDYDLSAVEPLPDRPSVRRCPECGLINPALSPDYAHAPS